MTEQQITLHFPEGFTFERSTETHPDPKYKAVEKLTVTGTHKLTRAEFEAIRPPRWKGLNKWRAKFKGWCWRYSEHAQEDNPEAPWIKTEHLVLDYDRWIGSHTIYYKKEVWRLPGVTKE